MKIFVLLSFFAYLQIASCKSLPRDIDDDFNKSLNQLSKTIENGVNLGEKIFRGRSTVVKYIAEKDEEITVKDMETVKLSTLKEIEELGNVLCYEHAEADLADAWYRILLYLEGGFNLTMENMEVVCLDEILRLHQYQGIIVGFEESYHQCNNDDCKQKIYDNVVVEIDLVGNKIEVDLQNGLIKIDNFIVTHVEGTLMPALDAFTNKSGAVLLKAKECASTAEM